MNKSDVISLILFAFELRAILPSSMKVHIFQIYVNSIKVRKVNIEGKFLKSYFSNIFRVSTFDQ